jgi:carboxylate-amine ligase
MRSGNDSRWLRSQFHRLRDLPLVVEAMSNAWRGVASPGVGPAEPTAVLRRRIRATSEPMSALPASEPGVSVPMPERLH